MKRKSRKPVEATKDFKARIAIMLNNSMPPVKKVDPLLVRGKGNVLYADKRSAK